MSIILSKIKNGLYTGEDMWISILMSAAIIIGLGWFFTVAWQRNELLRERLKNLSNHKEKILSICKIVLSVFVIAALFKTYLAYMTLFDGIIFFLCYQLCRILLERLFSGEWSFEPAKKSTIIYAIVAAGLIVYIKFAGPFFSSPSLFILAIAIADGIDSALKIGE